MFKWRSDKIKITVVFKLQFHATQVSEFGGNGLALSLVPAENGKPTAKLEKCALRENCCYWENPVYETVKFVQDLKTGKIQERIYYFIVSTGSPKGSLVGEFSINIADYAVANKAYSISFPFKSNPNSHLHVYIQRVQENSGQRDVEENEASKISPEEKTLRRHFSEEVINTTSSVEDEPLRKTASLLPPGVNAIRRGSNGSDITLTSTDSSSGLDTPRDPGVRNPINAKKDQTSNGSNYLDQDRAQWELAIVPANGSSTEYFMSSPSYAFSSERYQMGLDDNVERLKADLIALSRRAEVSELELQTLRKQIVKESKKGQDLLREVTSLKQERDALKDECEKLNARQKRSEDFMVKNKLQFEGDPWELINEIREELNHEKQLNSSLQLQLQKTQESNAELLLAVQDLEEMLDKNNRGMISDLPNRSASGESAVEIEESIVRSQSDDDEEQKALEELVKQHSDAQESYLLEQKIMDLCSEIEMYRRDKDELEMQMEQLALDYEILKQENHEFSCKLEQTHIQEQLKMPYEYLSSHATRNEIEAQKENLQNKIEEQSEEISRCVNAIKELEDRNKSLEENLRKQAENFEADNKALTYARMEQEHRAAEAEAALSRSNAAINELETEIVKLKNELKQQSEELQGSWATIKCLETRNRHLEEELEKQAQGSINDKESLAQARMELEQRALQAEDAVASSNTIINELETRIQMLEDELKKQSDESSHARTTIAELKALVHDLEEELDKQAEGFEADLEAVINAKVEQEKRAIQAEEALRLMRWKNVNTVMRIQDEFKKLYAHMQRSLEASEKQVGKAVTESAELRRQNRYLQGMFQKAREELQSVKNDYETKLQNLYSQISMKSTQMEQIMVENEEDPEQFEKQKQNTDEVQQNISAENFKLRAEIERLISENKSLAELAGQSEKLKYELEQTKAVIKERDLLVECPNVSVKDEKELEVSTMESEVEALRAQCDNLKHSLYEDELEKEKLRKQVFQLQADLKKKDEAISSIEKKSKENNGRVQVNEKSRPTFKNTKSEVARGAKEVITLKEKIKLLEGHVKSKEAAMETSTAAFVEKEKELHGQIKKLQARLQELNQHCTDIDLEKVKEEKVSVGMQADCSPVEVTLAIDDEPEDGIITTEDLNSSLLDSDEKPLSSSQANTSSHISVDDEKFDILLKEMLLLKERNKSMEMELKEMQDRYSGISLQFAEVEGERQRLVMKLRNIKSAKKS